MAEIEAPTEIDDIDDDPETLAAEARLSRRRVRLEQVRIVGKGLVLLAILLSLLFNFMAWRDSEEERRLAPSRTQAMVEHLMELIAAQLAEHDRSIKKEFADHERRQEENARRILADVASIGGFQPCGCPEPAPNPNPKPKPGKPTPSPTPKCLPVPLICVPRR